MDFFYENGIKFVRSADFFQQHGKMRNNGNVILYYARKRGDDKVCDCFRKIKNTLFVRDDFYREAEFKKECEAFYFKFMEHFKNEYQLSKALAPFYLNKSKCKNLTTATYAVLSIFQRFRFSNAEVNKKLYDCFKEVENARNATIKAI